jgi:uncharacterized protein YifE (UPF0438 family)
VSTAKFEGRVVSDHPDEKAVIFDIPKKTLWARLKSFFAFKKHVTTNGFVPTEEDRAKEYLSARWGPPNGGDWTYSEIEMAKKDLHKMSWQRVALTNKVDRLFHSLDAEKMEVAGKFLDFIVERYVSGAPLALEYMNPYPAPGASSNVVQLNAETMKEKAKGRRQPTKEDIKKLVEVQKRNNEATIKDALKKSAGGNSYAVVQAVRMKYHGLDPRAAAAPEVIENPTALYPEKKP